jgi:hypothetical protein
MKNINPYSFSLPCSCLSSAGSPFPLHKFKTPKQLQIMTQLNSPIPPSNLPITFIPQIHHTYQSPMKEDENQKLTNLETTIYIHNKW